MSGEAPELLKLGIGAYKRTYAREWVRNRGRKKYATANLSRTRCAFKSGPYECRGILETVVDRNGRMIVVCPLCVRREKGICRDCPAKVEGRVRTALRCRKCKARALKASSERYIRLNREKVRATQRNHKRRWRETHREQDCARSRAYSKAHRAERTAYGRRWRTENREKFLAQRKRYRAKLASRQRGKE